MKKLIAETIGTFTLVLCGTGAIVINDHTQGAIGHFGISFAFGLIVTLMIYAFAKISGAHINPAVTVGFWASNLFDQKWVIPYFFAQCLGAILASLLLHYLYPWHSTLGATLYEGASWPIFLLELLLSYILMIGILVVSQTPKWQSLTALVVGVIVMLEAYFAGPITGASMNPARSLGPALVSGQLQGLWLYIFAPLLGMILAAFSWIVYIKIKNNRAKHLQTEREPNL